MVDSTDKILNVIAQTIFDKKGMNILALDVRDVSTLTDFFIIAEGTVDRHVSSIGSGIIEELHKLGLQPLHVEGIKEGDWVIIDYGDILIHLFIPDLREKYALETLFGDAKIVDLTIDSGRKVHGQK